MSRLGRSRNPTHRRWPARVVAVLVVVGLVGTMAFAQAAAQRQSRRDLEDRFEVRAQSAATFLQSTVEHTLRREQDLATDRLGGEVDQAEFDEFLQVFGFGPAVLLNSRGEVLRVAPEDPELLGVDLSERYDHLASAVAGTPAVSNEVPSAVEGVPIVAFAVPIATADGRRVFSGAYGLASTPMGDYLDHANPFTGGSAYLIDSSGQIISAPGDVSGPLADEDAALARMLDETGRGAYDPETGPARFYVAEPVVGTPWTLVLAVPAKVLYLPLERSGRILPWLFLGAFAAAAALLAGVLVRGRESRRQLRVDAAIDGLTSVRNRRSAQAGLHRLLDDDAARPGGVAVLMIDADHFKQVNDRFGHAAGDEALRSVAATIRRCLRSCDIVGRWGGEEFLVALPGTDEAGAEAVAERIRLAVIEDVVDCDGQVVPLTVSIGLAVALPGESLASLVAAADTALYRAKDDGRNRVRINEPTPSGARVLVAPGGR